MKDLIKKLLLCFNKEKNIISETEYFLSGFFECKGKIVNDNLILVKDIIKEFSSRDSVKLSISTVADDNICLTNKNLVENAVLQSFLKDIENDDLITIQITVEKKINNSMLSVYCYDKFVEYLQNKTTFELMHIFAKLLKNKEKIFFITFDNDEVFATNTITFKNEEIERQVFDRTGKLENCKKASCFYNFNEIPLIPDDFEWILRPKENKLKKMFNKIKNILSMVYIVNIASISDNSLSLQISGYKNSQFEYNINSDGFENEELFKIYKWIYTDGNCIDKSAIARNIISLHCQYSKMIDTDGKTMSSIQSNYQIYQKDNVNQYLNLKNKLAEYMINIFEKISDAIIQLGDRLKANVFAFLTFLVAVFLSKIAPGKDIDFLSKEMTVFIYFVFVCSGVFLYISFLEMKYKINNIEDGYQNLKSSYTDLLDEEDINSIFKNNCAFDKKIDDIKKLRNKIIYIWIGLIVCGIICVEFLSQYAICYPNIVKIFSYKINC